MGKRKREDDDYVDFCSGLQKATTNGLGDTSYVYSQSRAFKRPKINPNFYKPASVHYRYLKPQEAEYKKIQKLIRNDRIVIEDILEVKNPTLEEAFTRKKEEKFTEFGNKVQEIFAFHGTKDCNVDSICKFNFDWRLNGSNKGHKFGKGVCFSKSATYASNYSDKHKFSKVMIVAKVLIANVCRGYHDMSIPPSGYDTSQKGENGVVLVKYEDNEFFPAYVIQYHFQENTNVNDYRYRNKRKCKNLNNVRYYSGNPYFNFHDNHPFVNNQYYSQCDRYGYNNQFCFQLSVNYPSYSHNNRNYADHDYSIDGQYNNNNNYYAFN